MFDAAEPPKYLRPKEAATYLGLSVNHLAKSRLDPPQSVGPPYSRLGNAIVYATRDLDAWVAENRVEPGQPERPSWT